MCFKSNKYQQPHSLDSFVKNLAQSSTKFTRILKLYFQFMKLGLQY
jgi:hypothetical protein